MSVCSIIHLFWKDVHGGLTEDENLFSVAFFRCIAKPIALVFFHSNDIYRDLLSSNYALLSCTSKKNSIESMICK